MFLILLRFAHNKGQAPRLMAGHNDWIAQGFADGVFLLTGSIKPGLGGAILAAGCTLAALQQRIAADPFVAEEVVTAEIVEIAPGRLDTRLAFLSA